jgi:hypothetical protein
LSEDIIGVLEKIGLEKRLQVKEVTLGMARNIEAAMKKVFTGAKLVTDRFHVVRLAMKALQHIRVNLKWKEMDKENEAVKSAKEKNQKYEAEELENGDTTKQLLARCRYALAKKEGEWTENQEERTAILFKKYPKLAKAYHQTMAFRNIYEDRSITNAKTRLTDVQWGHGKENQGILYGGKYREIQFGQHPELLCKQDTNANAESFNSKLKLFRANLRGVTDTKFFFFRLAKFFA